MSSSPPLNRGEQQQPPLARVALSTEYVCGVFAGFGKVFAGHPFDTIKSRVQSGAFRNAREAVRATVRQEGVRALYQGVGPPCASVCFVSGMLFYCNGLIRGALQPDPAYGLTFAQMAVAGGGAGAVTTLVVTPLDAIKLRLQIHNKTRACAAGGPAAPTTASVVRALGPLGMSRGFVPTLLREIGTFGIYFPLCEAIKQAMVRAGRRRPQAADAVAAHETKALPLSARIFAAGSAGVLCWLPCYPIDQVKTAMQLSPEATPTMRGCAARLYREGGGRAFFKGLGPCLLRAFPAYATHMTMFDIMIAAAAAQ
jgi:solute carrier family 25 carnitine/acylcarnitine transporter 20/29